MFTCMTFNLRYDCPEDGENAWPHRVSKVDDVIRSCNPLVIGTQEGLYHMLRELDKNLSDYSWVGACRSGGHTDEHNAIYYKHSELELVKDGQFWLSESPQEPGSMAWGSSLPRICTWAHFRFYENLSREFLIFNTHLDHVSSYARTEGIRLILNSMREHFQEDPLPMILMGDFNAPPSEPAMTWLGENLGIARDVHLVDSFSALGHRPGQTFHDFLGGDEGEPIDYIFLSSEWNLVSTRVVRDNVRGLYASDHYPVCTTIDFR